MAVFPIISGAHILSTSGVKNKIIDSKPTYTQLFQLAHSNGHSCGVGPGNSGGLDGTTADQPRLQLFQTNCAHNTPRNPSEEHPMLFHAASSRPNVLTYPQSAILPWLNVDVFPSSHSRNLLYVTCISVMARIGWLSNRSEQGMQGKVVFLRRLPFSFFKDFLG